MLRDVFYYGSKPNVHPREQFAENLADARAKAKTRDFWIINEFCDYRNFDWDFDFEFLPDEDVWAEEHNNVWPSQHQKDSGTWLCPKEHSDLIIYRNDVDPVKRKNERTSNWVLLDNIDDTKFDFSWHPDPTSPPYIYKWGCKFFPAELKHILEYHAAAATNEKYMNTIAELLPNSDCWVEHDLIDKTKFDMSWRPDPMDPPYIYVWGNKWVDAQLKPTLEYYAPNATERKYMTELLAMLPEWDKWVEVQDIDKDSFDFTWRPDPREPAYIYTWGNKWVAAMDAPTLEYHCDSATERKYVEEIVALTPRPNNFIVNQTIDLTRFDFSWVPDPTSPPYIYIWGNKHIPAELKSTVEYHVSGATEIKYMGNDVQLLPEFDCWKEIHSIDKSKFDLTWRPDPREPAFIYVWGNKHISGELQSTLEYHCPEATERKYMGDVEVLPELDRWKITQEVVDFDLTWRPDPREPSFIYVWGNKHVSGEVKPTIEYYCPGATERKYMGDVAVLPEWDRWVETQPVNRDKFDLTWRPDPREPAFIYVWGNKHISGELKPTIEYHVPGATERKYMTKPADVLPLNENWNIIQATENFDYTWRPDPREPDYIYVWGNKYIPAEIRATVEYHCPGATERKYMGDATVAPEWERYSMLLDVDKAGFDFSWRPDPREPAFIYVFGNQWNDATIEPTLEYHAPGATERKYMTDVIARIKPAPTDDRWSKLIPIDSFDYSWRPNPTSPPYIYVFGNKWNDAMTEPSVEYRVSGATDIKYVTDILATPKVDMSVWSINDSDDMETFDFSWRPNPHSPSQIYQWEDNGPRYTAPNATDVVLMKREQAVRKPVSKYKIKTSLDELINEHPDEVFWVINPDLNYDDFDFSWRPNEENFRHISVFGNEYSKNTQTYYVNGPMYMLGYREFNYVEEQLGKVDSNLSIFFIDRSNPESAARFEALKAKYGTRIQKTRYLNSWVDTINRCITKSQTKLFWVINSELDYSEFEFTFYPSLWQEKMVHVFGTQWSHWGNTYMINGETFQEDTKYIKIIEHLSNLNFVKSVKATAANCVYDVVVIDHGNKETASIRNQIESKVNGSNIIVVDYDNSYLNTIRNVLATLPTKKEHYIWICSSVCDYSNFDFTYICDPFTRENLHVFPSGKQKFGDTFLIDVNKTRELINEITELGEYDQVNYNQTMRANRLEAPKLITEHDTLVDAIKNSILDIDFPYATLMTVDNTDLEETEYEPLNLWSNDTKNIIITTTGATRVVIPTQAKDYIDYELYDYPYIKRAPKLVKSNPLDIVFLSNGETGADENYEHLLKVTENLPNRVVRVDGINGRAASYHAAAEASNTPWFFAVFAKLEVNAKFDWSWQPDRMQIPKHYIFHAKNPVNGLIYGHQAMIAYNKKLTLGNEGKGLDFTLDNHHEVVPLISGTACYNTDSFSTWRTAFREAIKLKMGNDDDSRERLEAWLTKGEGEFAEYSIKGAQDAITYYDEVNGDFDKLKLSYEWAWLREKFDQF